MTFTLDELTSQIQSTTGVPYDRARAIAEANTTPRGAAQQPRTATIAERAASRVAARGQGQHGPRGEKGEQVDIERSAHARGAFVYRFSQSRETQQTPGIPDLYLVWPDLAVWWEVKTATGVLSQAQARFAMQATANGTPYGCGTHADFLDWCTANGRRAK